MPWGEALWLRHRQTRREAGINTMLHVQEPRMCEVESRTDGGTHKGRWTAAALSSALQERFRGRTHRAQSAEHRTQAGRQTLDRRQADRHPSTVCTGRAGVCVLGTHRGCVRGPVSRLARQSISVCVFGQSTRHPTSHRTYIFRLHTDRCFDIAAAVILPGADCCCTTVFHSKGSLYLLAC